MSPSPFALRCAYYAELATAQEIDSKPDALALDRLGAWSRVQAARTDLSLYQQGNAVAALERAEGGAP